MWTGRVWLTGTERTKRKVTTTTEKQLADPSSPGEAQGVTVSLWGSEPLAGIYTRRILLRGAHYYYYWYCHHSPRSLCSCNNQPRGHYFFHFVRLLYTRSDPNSGSEFRYFTETGSILAYFIATCACAWLEVMNRAQDSLNFPLPIIMHHYCIIILIVYTHVWTNN